ncbi:hypothetical protein BH24ACT5_BH24ACT5_05700 [soil metagenome]
MNQTSLSSDVLDVAVCPDQGCDITSIVHRPTGCELLFRTPWGHSGRTHGAGPWAEDSATAWLDRYPGGWQLLLPNAGPPCSVGGTEWVFHGEASQAAWSVTSHGDGRLEAETVLCRAPLTVRRTIHVVGDEIRVTDDVTNVGTEDLDMVWGHHPAFGGDFVDSSTRLETTATVFDADPASPGTVLAPGARSNWPHAVRVGGGSIDLSVLSDEGAGVSHLGYLSGFAEGSARIVNQRRGLAVELSWPLDLMPHAWYWVENHASTGYPWFGRCHVFAFEPCSTAAAVGMVDAVKRELGVVSIGPLQTRSATVALSVRS